VEASKEVKPGQMMRFVYMRGKSGVWALTGTKNENTGLRMIDGFNTSIIV
jgi:hypothetical protein